jgi:ribosomal protein S18 acetylase RimI-like enzyme
MGVIFAVGFYQWLRYFSKDVDRLAGACAHMFELEAFRLAVDDGGAVIGMAACTDGRTPAVRIDPAAMRRHLGLARGAVAAKVLRENLEDHPYPFELKPGCGSIEFVATAAESRGQGVATEVLSHIMANAGYDSYVLEVADTNTTAVRVYERLGFREIHRVPAPNPKRSGINHLLYLEADRPSHPPGPR